MFSTPYVTRSLCRYILPIPKELKGRQENERTEPTATARSISAIGLNHGRLNKHCQQLSFIILLSVVRCIINLNNITLALKCVRPHCLNTRLEYRSTCHVNHLKRTRGLKDGAVYNIIERACCCCWWQCWCCLDSACEMFGTAVTDEDDDD